MCFDHERSLDSNRRTIGRHNFYSYCLYAVDMEKMVTGFLVTNINFMYIKLQIIDIAVNPIQDSINIFLEYLRRTHAPSHKIYLYNNYSISST